MRVEDESLQLALADGSGDSQAREWTACIQVNASSNKLHGAKKSQTGASFLWLFVACNRFQQPGDCDTLTPGDRPLRSAIKSRIHNVTAQVAE